ncbi:hypothetical protein [Pseudooceanicola atlanticus]|uniref:hypothetical protein n=1 Tax=Pseudooceanicola atlanticus TaxID=1461694 RepID=UPI0023547BB6|nr:hypothetical protein [Pseudooceanicola atlanticus]
MTEDDDFKLNDSEKLTIRFCEETGYLKSNQDLGSLVQMLLISGAFGKIKQKSALTHALYRGEDTTDQQPLKKKVEPGRRTKGDNRLENIMRGKLRVSRAEAQMFHLALRRGFGDEIADAIAPEEFALMSPASFHARIVAQGLPWPDDKLSPPQALEILALAQPEGGLSLRPAFVNSGRIPLKQKSGNEALRRIDTRNVHAAGAEFVIHLGGVRAPNETVLVFGMSLEMMARAGDNDVFCGFPLGVVVPQHAAATVDDTGTPFVMGSEIGDYALMALGVPTGMALEQTFDIDPHAARWSASDMAALVRELRPLIAKDRQQFRLAVYRYRIN